jgi:hypothetical protein
MPRIPLGEVRLPELHLPEMSRDQISRALADIRGDGAREAERVRAEAPRLELPDIELPKVDVPKVDVTKVELPKVDLSKVDLAKLDLPKAVADAAAAAGLVKRRRSRLPFVIAGMVTLAVVGYALLTSPTIRPRLDDAARKLRSRFDAFRGESMMDEPDFDLGPTVDARTRPEGTTTGRTQAPTLEQPTAVPESLGTTTATVESTRP